MPHWYLKAALQGGIARLPDPQRWNRLFQRYVTKSLDRGDDYLLEKWQQCERHLQTFHQAGGESTGFVAAELGTGWFPVTPVGFALAGADRVLSIDKQSLTQLPQLIETLEFYERNIRAEKIRLAPNLTDRALNLIEKALVGEPSMEEMYSRLGIELLLTDARSIDLPGNSVDLFVSNNTLEHIPGEVITGILTEFNRLGTADVVMSHYIDMADHYAGFDSSISVYNFLQFDKNRWRIFNNDLQYQNRLRVPDFRTIHSKAGWNIVAEENLSEPLDVLRAVPLAAEFEHYDESELAVYGTWMTSTR